MLMLLFLLPDFHGLLVSPYVGQMGFIETSRNPFFVSPDFFVALAFMLPPGHLEVFLLFFLYLGHCCCVFHKAFSALIPPVVPIRKWWITSSTCNMVSKMKGDKAKGSYGFMLSAGGMGTRAGELEEVLDGASTNVLLPKAGLLLFIQSIWKKIGPWGQLGWPCIPCHTSFPGARCWVDGRPGTRVQIHLLLLQSCLPEGWLFVEDWLFNECTFGNEFDCFQTNPIALRIFHLS